MEAEKSKENMVKANPDFVDLGLSVRWANTNIEADKVTNNGIYVAYGEVEPKKTYTERTYVCNGFKDAATCSGMGRIPTREEWSELKTKCVWERGNIGKCNGCFVTGPNKKTIFLPFTGRFEKTKKLNTNEGYYWSIGGLVANITKTNVNIMSNSACNGCAIRSVQDR